MKISLGIKPVALPGTARGIYTKFSQYLLPVVVGLVSLILIFLVIRPRVVSIFQLRTKIADSKQKVTILDDKLKILRGYNYNRLLSDVKKAEIALPSDKNLPSLLANLESLTAEAGTKIVVVQLSPGEIAPQAVKIEAENYPVKVTVAGGFFQIKSLLGKLIAAPRVMSVKSLTVSSATQEIASLSATLNLDSYFQTLSATKFKIDDPLKPLTPEEEKTLGKIVQPSAISFPPAPAPTGKPDPFAPF